VYCDKSPTPTVLEKICRHERPDAICAVPMIMDKIYKKKVLPAISASFWLRRLVAHPLSRQLVMKKIGRRLLDFFGGNLKVIAIGGAALNIETETFLREANFPYMAGYGLTETAPLLAAGRAGDPSVALGSVGPAVPGVEIRIAGTDPATGVGQIMARGDNIMQGYYKNQALTAETIDREGWLATGDLGFVDEIGNLHIKGRSKSVIVLSHGENIYPEVIEEKINAMAQVVDSLVVERGGRLEALVYLDYELVDREATGREAQRLHVQQLLTAIKAIANQGLPVYSRLHQVRERTEPFVKTATHKIKRYLYQ
jgi:long-chain acyl-CoA synthetase